MAFPGPFAIWPLIGPLPLLSHHLPHHNLPTFSTHYGLCFNNVEALVLLITSSFVLLLALIRKWQLVRRPVLDKGTFPPGPFAWPLIGHLHLLSHLPHHTFTTLSAHYGPILGLRFGHQRVVVVSTPALARQILVTHDKVLANRPCYEFISTLMYGSHNHIVMNSYCPQWRKLRKLCTLELFTAKRLHELEYVRNEEIRALLQHVHDESSSGLRVVDIGKCVGHMSGNLITRLLCSNACVHSKQGENLHMLVREFGEEAAATVGDFIPWLKWVDFAKKRRMRQIHARMDKVLSAILAECQSSMQTVSASGPFENLVHALLSKLHVNDDNSEGGVTMEEIKGVMLDMVIGGMHTTALTLEWAMAELLKNPHCLDRLRKEIGSALMSDKSKHYVTESDIPKLSYLKCVVKEIYRLHPVFPLSVPHVASEECKVHNYILPAQTHVFVNVWAIGRDEQVWHRANQFRPERFEGNDMDVKGQHFELIPFGSGRRICAGLPLALSIIEATLANLVYHFNWELPPGETCASINMSEKRGIALSRTTPVIALPKLRSDDNL